MKPKNLPQDMIDAARELYVRHNGGHHQTITDEMRALGFPFYRELLYSRRHSHGVTLGWPERFGWDALLPLGTGPRSRGRNRFEGWLTASFPEWSWNWRYQRYLFQRLGEVTTGESRRLMIFMPPRHGKSETVTVRYTAWRLLQNPRLNVIIGSYNQRLANKFSRKIKRIFHADDRIPQIPTPQLLHSSSPRLLSTASEWETSAGGVVRSAGVGAGIAGFGAGLIVIDDPVRNRADAESETYRDRVWDWFNDDIYTRLEPNASIIIIQTRWHEDDLAGRLLREQKHGGEHWEVVSLPALAEAEEVAATRRHGDAGTSSDARHVTKTNSNNAKAAGAQIPASPRLTVPASSDPPDPLGRRPGQALCPQLYNAKALERIRRKLGTYSFAALYQQQPAPAEGGMFRRSWFTQIVDEAPKNLRWKRGWDLAVSLKTSADYTASFRCAFDRDGNLYIADGLRARLEYPDQRRLITERMKNDLNTEHGIEKALHGQAFVQELRRIPELRRYAFRPVKVEGDKLTRALTWLNLAEAGKVFLVGGPWIGEFVDEIARFPKGRHDDQIDAVSLAVQMLTHPDRRLYVF